MYVVQNPFVEKVDYIYELPKNKDNEAKWLVAYNGGWQLVGESGDVFNKTSDNTGTNRFTLETKYRACEKAGEVRIDTLFTDSSMSDCYRWLIVGAYLKNKKLWIQWKDMEYPDAFPSETLASQLFGTGYKYLDGTPLGVKA